MPTLGIFSGDPDLKWKFKRRFRPGVFSSVQVSGLLFSVSKHTVIFTYWSSFHSSKVADMTESSPKRQTSQVRREMPLNAGKPNRSSSSGAAVGKHRQVGDWRGKADDLGVTGSQQMWLGIRTHNLAS